jgi:hypothetical protein
MILPKVRTGLLRNRLDVEVLVYDQRDDVVHLLNETTACVLDLLDEGDRTSEEIEEELARRTGGEPSDDLLILAVEELRNANLLESTDDWPPPLSDVSRREMLRKLALTGAATLIIPAITSLSPRRAYGQASGECLPKKACCNVDADCCSNKCDDSTGTGCQTGPLECH